MNDRILRFVNWCRLKLDIPKEVTILMSKCDLRDYWGMCRQISSGVYHITIHMEQEERDLLATCAHEMVHVKQWVHNTWRGDGEDEANELQYALTDDFYSQEHCASLRS